MGFFIYSIALRVVSRFVQIMPVLSEQGLYSSPTVIPLVQFGVNPCANKPLENSINCRAIPVQRFMRRFTRYIIQFTCDVTNQQRRLAAEIVAGFIYEHLPNGSAYMWIQRLRIQAQ